MFKRYLSILKREFAGYNAAKLGKDALAGVTVAAVALPLALAFGVSSGASAAAGLVTAIISGVAIGALSGASYQISGPTGAMSAILVSLVAQYGIQGMFMASFIAGVLLLLCAVFKLGGLVSYLPSPVITGFTSGIAVIIALGQIDNLTGFHSSGLSNLEKIASYFTTPQQLDPTAFIIGVCVIVFMLVYPKKLSQYFPGSLAAIILATAVKMIMHLDVPSVGEIPRTLFLADRLDITAVNLADVPDIVVPAVSIAALGLIESLLCGASAGRMKNERLDADVELAAQGIGNMLLPLFGGVPSTAAIARTSVAIKSGGVTRLTSVFHALVLLLSMFVLGGVMSAIPLSALAGVLIVTAVRMNDMKTIKAIFSKKLKTAMGQFLITMCATVVFDLTKAILIGVAFSLILFVVKVSDMQVTVAKVDPERLDESIDHKKLEHTSVVYITGPLYFGACSKLEEKIADVGDSYNIIFSMRGVTVADISGIEALHEYCERLISEGRMVYFACVQPSVMDLFERTGLRQDRFTYEMFFWSADKVFEHISSL